MDAIGTTNNTQATSARPSTTAAHKPTAATAHGDQFTRSAAPDQQTRDQEFFKNNRAAIQNGKFVARRDPKTQQMQLQPAQGPAVNQRSAWQQHMDYLATGYQRDVVTFGKGEAQGAGQAVKSAGAGMYQAATHPIATASAVGNMAQKAINNPGQAYKDTKAWAGKTLNEAATPFRNGDMAGAGKITGSVLANTAMVLVPGTKEGKALAAATAARVAPAAAKGVQLLSNAASKTVPSLTARVAAAGATLNSKVIAPAANLAQNVSKIPSKLWNAAANSPVGKALGVTSSAGVRATAPVKKFSDYIFKDGATHGKNVPFEKLGYGKPDSSRLARMWEEQAQAKYARGEYTKGKLDEFGQRINIEIEVPGTGGAAGKTSYMRSGWMIQPDKNITLNTPFSGFTR